MPLDRKRYIRLYDRVLSRVYDLLMKWWLAPFGGEGRVRKQLLEPVSFGAKDHILDLCCGTGNATLAIAKEAGHSAEVVGLDLSLGQIRRGTAKTRDRPVRFLVGDAYWTRVMLLLAGYAFWAGTGYRTTVGLGQTQSLRRNQVFSGKPGFS